MSPEARLVLVAGPSGAGKDTLIRLAATALAGEPQLSFPRRVVTRVADASEDHDTLGEAAFAQALAAGAFALHWRAHGLGYGIPRAALAPGGVAVCNVSRAIVAQARREHGWVRFVAVTAPATLRAARVAGRGREPADDARLLREVPGDMPEAADLVIDNSGAPEAGAASLIAFLRQILER